MTYQPYPPSLNSTSAGESEVSTGLSSEPALFSPGSWMTATLWDDTEEVRCNPDSAAERSGPSASGG